MTHLQMKLHHILLLLSGLASHAIATTETICELLAQHRYKDIGLQSITWDNYRQSVLLFTSPQTRYYSLPVEKVTRNSVDLSEASPLNIEEKGEYKTAFGLITEAQATLRATYMFYLWKYTIVPIWSYKHIVLMATDRGVLTGNFKYDRTEEVTKPDGTALPDVSLASIGYYGPVLNGYVLYSDESHGYLTIGQFQVHYDGSKVTGLPPAKDNDTSRDPRPFYYLQVSDSPHDVHLVHPQTPLDATAQLFAPGSAVPRAFLDQRNNLVLFDSETGCVHIILDLGELSIPEAYAHSQERHIYPRINIPFEKYFKCAKERGLSVSNRCHVVRGGHRPTGVVPDNSWSTENVDSFSAGRTISVALLLVVLAGGLLYVIMVKKKTSKQAVGSRSRQVKSLASSSAVSGTSRTGSKRTASSSSFTGTSKTGKSKIVYFN